MRKSLVAAALTAIAGFAAWFVVLTLVMGFFRIGLVLSGRKAANSFAVNGGDLPGFGEAPEPERPQSMPEAGAYLAELVEAECPGERVVLVGHSMGTQIVAEAASHRPDLVASVVRRERPDWAELPLTRAGGGTDNVAWPLLSVVAHGVGALAGKPSAARDRAATLKPGKGLPKLSLSVTITSVDAPDLAMMVPLGLVVGVSVGFSTTMTVHLVVLPVPVRMVRLPPLSTPVQPRLSGTFPEAPLTITMGTLVAPSAICTVGVLGPPVAVNPVQPLSSAVA